MCSLDLFIDGKDIIRVNWWIRRPGLNEEYMPPIILPRKSKVTELIVKWCHLKPAHCVRHTTFNEIRDRDFRIIDVSSIGKSVVFNCVTCPKLRGEMGVQIMADLPKDRFQEAAPFTYCVADMFGPLKIKVKRSEVKCYGSMLLVL